MRRLLVKLARSAEVALNSWLRFGIVATKSIDVQIANSSIGVPRETQGHKASSRDTGMPPAKEAG